MDIIDTLDQAIERYGNERESTFITHAYEIKSKELFKGHCSNLQVWAENNYDTRLLDSNLSFPLLRQLSEAGDLKAISVFKAEIKDRFESGYLPVQEFLISEGYLDYLSGLERQELFKYVLNVNVWISIAEAYLQDCKLKKAIEAYEYALEIDPINEYVIRELCAFSLMVNDFKRALKYYTVLSELYSLKSDEFIKLGDIYLNLGQFNCSEAMYYCALGEDHTVTAKIKLGDLYFYQGKLTHAKRMYIEALNSDPSDVLTRLKMSEFLYQKEGIPSAILTLKIGLEYNPSEVVLLRKLKRLYKESKKLWSYYKTALRYKMARNNEIKEIYKLVSN